MPGELEGGGREGEAVLVLGHAGEALSLANGVGEFLAAPVLEDGLVVEQVHLRGGAGLAEVGDALGPGVGGGAGVGGGGGEFAVQQGG